VQNSLSIYKPSAFAERYQQSYSNNAQAEIENIAESKSEIWNFM
jgi:hypothetical protein